MTLLCGEIGCPAEGFSTTVLDNCIQCPLEVNKTSSCVGEAAAVEINVTFLFLRGLAGRCKVQSKKFSTDVSIHKCRSTQEMVSVKHSLHPHREYDEACDQLSEMGRAQAKTAHTVPPEVRAVEALSY